MKTYFIRITNGDQTSKDIIKTILIGITIAGVCLLAAMYFGYNPMKP